MTPPLGRRQVKLDDDVTLDVQVGGPDDGAPVLFLHGFPDFSHGWRRQLPQFIQAGYRVIAPDLHGYAASSKPKALSRYRLDNVAGDIVKLMAHLGHDKFHVVGHDWGAALTWTLAAVAPERLSTATVICVPHLKVFFDHVRRNKHGQMLKSWYMAFFQLPLVPELMFKAKRGRWLAGLLAKSGRRGAFTPEDQTAYAEAWSMVGAPTAMLNWYRANLRGARGVERDALVTTPMLIIWGDRDQALNHYMADDSAARCTNARVLHFDKGTHWVHVEFAPAVNVAILEHVKNH